MSLVKAVMFGEFVGIFSKKPAIPLTPGQDIAAGFAKYLKMGQNAGGFPTSNVIDTPTGLAIGGVFASQLPSGLMVGSQIAVHLTTMAMTYMSGQQTAPPIVPPSHTADLMSLFQEFPPDMKFAKDLSEILDKWTKTWTVIGLIPGTPPVPFAGPLS